MFTRSRSAFRRHMATMKPTTSTNEAVKFLNVSTHKFETLADGALKSRLASAKVVFFGEVHHNPNVLVAQHSILREMLNSGNKLSIVFEQFNIAQQRILDQYCNPQEGSEPLSFDRLKETYDQSSEGFDLAHYRTLFDECKSHSGCLAKAGFVSREDARSFIKSPEETLARLEEKFGFHRDLYTAGSPEHFRYFQELILGRAPTDDDKDFGAKIFPAQVLKDSVMAWSISNALRDESRDNSARSEGRSNSSHAQVLAILGSGHMDYGFGVPERLAEVFGVPRGEQLLITTKDLQDAALLDKVAREPANGDVRAVADYILFAEIEES